MKKLIDSKIVAVLTIEAMILKDLKFGGMPLDLGAVTLTLDDKNFILDTTETDYTNLQKAGTKFTLESKLEIDLDTFAKGDEYNYELLLSDLKDRRLQPTIFIGGDEEDVENILLENAEILLHIIVDEEKEIIINLDLE